MNLSSRKDCNFLQKLSIKDTLFEISLGNVGLGLRRESAKFLFFRDRIPRDADCASGADEPARGRAQTRPGMKITLEFFKRAARRRCSPIMVACIAPVRRSRRVGHSAAECRNN